MNNLVFYGTDFGGLVRQIASKYGLPDPAEYMPEPWRPDRWCGYCQERIAAYWDDKLHQEAHSKETLSILDISALSVMRPAKLWSMAGLDATEVKKACIANYMTLGV